MSLSFGTDRRPRRPDLTPMIDVVFLLLVFFMLASRFGIDRALPLAVAGAGQGYSGPPRLVTVLPEAVKLNGVRVSEADLADQVRALTSDPADTVILRPGEGTELQRIVAVLEALSAAGLTRVVLLE